MMAISKYLGLLLSAGLAVSTACDRSTNETAHQKESQPPQTRTIPSQTLDDTLTELSPKYNLNGFDPNTAKYIAAFITADSFPCKYCELAKPGFTWLAKSDAFDPNTVGFVILSDLHHPESVDEFFEVMDKQPSYPRGTILQKVDNSWHFGKRVFAVGSPYIVKLEIARTLAASEEDAIKINPRIEYAFEETSALLDILNNNIPFKTDTSQRKILAEYDFNNPRHVKIALSHDVALDPSQEQLLTITMPDGRYAFASAINAAEEKIGLLPPSKETERLQKKFLQSFSTTLNLYNFPQRPETRREVIETTIERALEVLPKTAHQPFQALFDYLARKDNDELDVVIDQPVLHPVLRKELADWSQKTGCTIKYSCLNEDELASHSSVFPSKIRENLRVEWKNQNYALWARAQTGLVEIPADTPREAVLETLKAPKSLLIQANDEKTLNYAAELAAANPDVRILATKRPEYTAQGFWLNWLGAWSVPRYFGSGYENPTLSFTYSNNTLEPIKAVYDPTYPDLLEPNSNKKIASHLFEKTPERGTEE